MGADLTREQEEALQEIWQALRQTESETARAERHLSDSILYDLALGEPAPEQREEAQGHLADCDECIRELIALQAAVAADREVRAVWNPKVLHAAGSTQSPPVIKDHTEDGKYLLTLQPTRDGRKDLLTLEATHSFRQKLEGLKVVIVSCKGNVILRGTISGGTVTRLINRNLRDEWPFRIRAG